MGRGKGRHFAAGLFLGQGATEYLVLLAAVLVIALVSISLLGFFPGMSSDVQIAQSRSYWMSARPIGIADASAGGADALGSELRFCDEGHWGYVLSLQNNGGDAITLKGIATGFSGDYDFTVDGTDFASNEFCTGYFTNVDAPVRIGPGESAVVRVTLFLEPHSDFCSSAGSTVETDVAFLYDTQIGNNAQYGSKPLALKCS